jgi:galactokinase
LTPLSDPPIRLLAKFEQLFPLTPPQMIVQAPGREMWAAANVNGTAHISVGNAETDTQTSFSYQSAKIKQTTKRRPLPTWARYLAGVSVLIDVPDMPGIDAVVCGNEAAGPRYEFALGILFGALWREVNGQTPDVNDLVELTERVRREYVGR